MADNASAVVHAYQEDEASLTLLSRGDDGRLVTRRVAAEYIVYLRNDDLDDEIRAFIRASPYVRGVRFEGPWVRVGFAARALREDFCQHRASPIVQWGIPTYEGDVSPVLRYAVDNNLTIARPRRAYLDLETDSRVPFSRKEEMRILTWSVVDEQGRLQVGVLSADSDRAERVLLDELWAALGPYDQVVAWNGDGFDFPVLHARTQARGCRVDPRRWLWLDHLLLFKRMNLNAAESGDEKQSMRLGDIAQAILGDGKEESPPEVVARFGTKSLGALSWQLWEAGGVFRDILVRYNIKDTDLLRRIEDETGYIALLQTLCEVCHVFGDTHGLNPTHQMDGFMMRLGIERNQHFPTKHYRQGNTQFKGAFVMEPKCVGIERGVHVCDFASLYPSIILTWNMSPDTKAAGAPTGERRPTGICESPLTGVCFRTEERGILPQALEELIRMRKVWSERQAAEPPGTDAHHDARRRSMAYKVAANSFYGVVGSPFSRFFDREIAESITQNGVWLIQKTIEAAEARGMRAVYGDTDSVFVQGVSQDEFAAFVDWCNVDLYPRLLAEVGCTKNAVKLAYEKAFAVLVMPSAKKYVGRYLHYKGKAAAEDSKPEIKGLEYKRGDALQLARRLQSEVIDLLCGGLGIVKSIPTPTTALMHFHEAVARARDYVLNTDRLPIEQVKLSKALSRPLKEYAVKTKKDGTAASQPPHVMLAKVLAARGEDVSEGTRIEYIVTDGAVSPAVCMLADEYTGTEVDRYHLWESLVYPATQRLLEAAFPEEDWAALAKVRPPKPRKPPATPRRSKKITPDGAPGLRSEGGTA